MARQLPRVLRFFDISVLSSASMAPAYSLASTMGPMVAVAGNLAPLSFVVLCAIMLCIAVGYGELSRAAPNAGSSYSWIRMAFGPYAGSYGAWLLLLSNFFATMATSVPAGIYTLDLIAPNRAQNPIWDAAVGALWIAGSAVLLYIGVRPTAIVTAGALLIEIGVLFITAIAGAFLPHGGAAVHPASTHDTTAFTLSISGFAYAMALSIWMSDGWEISASTSEEVTGNDRTTSGRGGITGLLVTGVVLTIAMIAYLHLGTVAGFTKNQADSMRYVADLLGSPVWRPVIILTVMVSTSSALWTTILYLSRSVYAMGRDGVLPRALGTLDHRDEPLWALAVVGVLVAAFEMLTGFSRSAADQLNTVLNASSVFLGLLFVCSAAAAVRLFWKRAARRGRGVWIPAAGMVALLAVIIATFWMENRTLQYYAAAGVCLGVPFALWRGWASRGAAGQPPGGYEPTALAS